MFHISLSMWNRESSFYPHCFSLEVVEPQCWVWAAQNFTINFLCANERWRKFWDVWLILISISAEMSLPSHRWLQRKLTDRIRIDWMEPAATPSRQWSNFPLGSGNGKGNELLGFAHASVITPVFILGYSSLWSCSNSTACSFSRDLDVS